METVLITGANRGIGLELVQRHTARGDKVIALCRQSSDKLYKTGAEIVDGIDMADATAVEGLKCRIEENSIDRLIANAGMRSYEGYENLDFDAVRYQFEVNTLGPLRLVRTLDKMLKDGAKIVLMSTAVASISDNESGGEFGYRMSKTALNMAGVNLSHALKYRNIAVFLLHPGWVQTQLGGEGALIDTQESASGIIVTTDGLGLDETGTFWHAVQGTQLPW